MIDRYSTPEMNEIWTEKNKFKKWLLIEIYTVEAYTRLGVIPDSDCKIIVKKAKFDLKRIQEIEKDTKHDVIAFTRSVGESLGIEKKWIHYGLTSSDVVDTGLSCLIKDSNEIIEDKILRLLDLLKGKAIEYKDLPTIGRTHGIHAEVTSFGIKYALWYEILSRQYKRFLDARVNIEVGLVSGAVGNYANIDPYVQEYVCGKLELSSVKISTQILSRDRHAQYINTVSIIGCCLENIATEVRSLQRTEIGEVEEFFSLGQKGSSAMPHKKNPVSFENICGLSRVLRGFALTALENITLWHERDITHSSAERIIIPGAIKTLDYMVERLYNNLSKLVVKISKIKNNINMTNGLVYSQYVLLKLIEKKGWTREKAYDRIQPIAMKAYSENVSFLKLLKEANLGLSDEDLNSCFNPDSCNKNIDYIYKRLGFK